MVKLDILSDPICPWCYIGKTQLERALLQVNEPPFAIEWHPFQLNPDMPKAGMDRREYLERKFGGKTQAVQVYSQIENHAKSLDLPIDFAAMKRTPNTIDAHRLIHWAGIEQKQSEIVDLLFDAYFCKGQDIGDADILCELARNAEIDGEAIAKLLQSEEDVKNIIERDSHSREMGVKAVPTFIVGGRHVVPGAQPPELWLDVIKDIKNSTH